MSHCVVLYSVSSGYKATGKQEAGDAVALTVNTVSGEARSMDEVKKNGLTSYLRGEKKPNTEEHP